jgi:hypothetical protein
MHSSTATIARDKTKIVQMSCSIARGECALVLTGPYLNFMIAGHTRCATDGYFGLLKNAFKCCVVTRGI